MLTTIAAMIVLGAAIWVFGAAALKGCEMLQGREREAPEAAMPAAPPFAEGERRGRR